MDLFPIGFGPRIDVERADPFIAAHPQTLIKEKRFNHVPYITGLNKNEASFIVAGSTNLATHFK